MGVQEVRFYDAAEDHLLKFAVIFARSDGKWVLCRHRERSTLEVPGGHREPGETIDEAAARELREETGAMEFAIRPVCAYSVVQSDPAEESFGMIYCADIRRFAPEIHSEIAEIFLLESWPENWTYPEIQPRLAEEIRRRGILDAPDVWTAE